MLIKSLGVLSVGKMAGLTYACIGLLIGGLVSLAALAGAGMGGGRNGGMQAMFLGAGAVILFPLIYGGMGFIGGIISAAIYNVIAGMAGGIEIELVESGAGNYRGTPKRLDSERTDKDW